METLYIVPSGCPEEDLCLTIPWGPLAAVRQKTFEIIWGKSVNTEAPHKENVWLSWTCAGCTKSAGENPCPERRCGLGGREI
jgi:hypothetical protein